MTEDVFDRFYALLEKKTGISLNASKQYLVEARLADMCKASGCPSVPEFLQVLVSTAVGELHWKAFDALTTNETMFFRDRPFFDALAGDIFPRIIEKKREERTLRILCSAVSTGQEAYSVAILLRQHFPELSNWNVFIQATDLSVRALDRARAGVYTQTEVERGMEPALIAKYFQRMVDGRFQIIPAIRDAVTFIPTNLVEPAGSFPKFDIIFLRNVLIYFSAQTKLQVLEKMHRQLSPDTGVLALGSTESILSSSHFKVQHYGKISCYQPV